MTSSVGTTCGNSSNILSTLKTKCTMTTRSHAKDKGAHLPPLPMANPPPMVRMPMTTHFPSCSLAISCESTSSDGPNDVCSRATPCDLVRSTGLPTVTISILKCQLRNIFSLDPQLMVSRLQIYLRKDSCSI